MRESLSDEELCQAVRDGASWPLSLLWERHSTVAGAWAMKKDPNVAEDIVSEGFALVFQALLDGGGPEESFRGYLYKTMESLLAKHWRLQRRTDALGDLDALTPHEAENSPEAISEEQERGAAASALAGLPDRWHGIIVAVDIEGRPVQDVAAELGLSPNSASVLLKRAREGLRKAWLEQLHRPTAALPDACAGAVKHFGILRWGKRGTRRRAAAERHLEGCHSCRSRYTLFLEQAASVGLGLAALLAVTRDWREKLVPTLATSAVVVASFSVTTSFDPEIFTPPPHTEPAETDDSGAASGGGAGSGGAGGDAAPGGAPVRDDDDADRERADPSPSTPPEESDDAERSTPPGVAPTAPPHEAAEEDGMLYFGDWTGWDEDLGEFIAPEG